MSGLPVEVYDAKAVAELDRRVIAAGVPGFDLMGRAASAAFDTIAACWPLLRSLTAVCGPGNNGGDGFLIAAKARAAGIAVRLVFLGDRAKAKGDAARALTAFEQAGGEIEAFTGALPAAEVVVDALLGTGLGRPVEGRFLAAVQAINAAGAAGAGVFAVDIPSGIDAGSGRAWGEARGQARGEAGGEAVRADATATFIGLKLGLLTGAGPAHTGALSFHGLGAAAAVYDGVAPTARRVEQAAVRLALPPRARDDHKGRHGHVLCVGGDHGMGGAVRMAAEAALRVGAGLVSVATRPENAPVLTQARPELMCLGAQSPGDLDALLDKASVVALGPGLGQGDWGQALYRRVLAADLPLVVDADALNLLAAAPAARGQWLLTPHPGEAGRLLGCASSEVQADRPAAAAELAARYNAAVVLKGAGSLACGESDGLWVCAAGNPGMATGGMGDVLTGVVAGLLAQGLSLEAAARIGAWVHASAGDAAAGGGERGLLPSDLLAALRRQVNP